MNDANQPCRLCGKKELSPLIDLGQQPIAHRLLDVPQEEFTHPLTLHFCRACGLGQICHPIDPEILYRQYNYCFSSWKPEPHRELELDLICSHKKGAKVFEIGCNDGLFLEQLKRCGQSVCVGLEPNGFARKIAVEQRGLPVFETFLNQATCETALATYGKFDLVVSRQVLEHVWDIGLFFQTANRLLAQNGLLFVDVPDVGPGLQVADCTIAWEEHVNYFTEDVLLRALDHHGFTMIAFEKYNYSGGTLAVLARRKTADDHFLANQDYRKYAADFEIRVSAYRDRLAATLSKAREKYQNIVIYGVGCRACTLINGLQLSKLFDFAVDDQVERQGKLMPGSHLPIQSTAVLARSGATSLVVLAVNLENEAKVQEKVRRACQKSEVSFLSVFGPSNITKELQEFNRALE